MQEWRRGNAGTDYAINYFSFFSSLSLHLSAVQWLFLEKCAIVTHMENHRNLI